MRAIKSVNMDTQNSSNPGFMAVASQETLETKNNRDTGCYYRDTTIDASYLAPPTGMCTYLHACILNTW